MLPTRDAATILLVEQDVAVASHILNILEQRGYHVLLAQSGQQALTLLRFPDCRPELILLSLDPDLVEGELFRFTQLRDPAWRTIPLVALFSGTLDPDVGANLQLSLCLRKPIQRDQLLLIVEGYCQAQMAK